MPAVSGVGPGVTIGVVHGSRGCLIADIVVLERAPRTMRNSQCCRARGPNEATDYRIEGKRLILAFPSKNRYILQRVEETN